ncbi:hyoscyamine 6-dioxygenase-like [Neltuma alba]|uniref:hyoscyamine 6-dioxygenase-like n=1 Tax=Neltuma alba TaxID=207710 RepID=UPI0010A4FCE2|nr:hyoscyamine 6-dioxygenase-like [Prosopis alba]XP_028755947.1 hyoscyamine 6-dioxygenase-like [Prosopis alba]
MEMKMEEMLVTSWYNLHSSVPPSHVHPPESRPGELLVGSSKSIPVIDLGRCDHPPHDTISLVLKASQEYGFFQVINHGVSEELMEDTLNNFKEFHGMPPKEKMAESSKSPNGICKLYTSCEVYRKDDNNQYWRDTMRHPCPPSGEYVEFWPQKPVRYREIVGKYTEELRKLGVQILKMLAEGLGLKSNYFCGELSGNPMILAHHYPPCPQPNLTLGSPKHKDPTLLTILLQPKGINGLQVLKDGQWIGVEPIPNAFVVNIGLLLQMISNRRLIGAEHRVVTNINTARTTVAYFIKPKDEYVIEPANSMITSNSPPLYKPISYSEFRKNFLNKGSSFEADLLYS